MVVEDQGGAGEKALAPYKVLDLTEGGFQLCGRMLGDLGADVVMVEPPEGKCSRRLGPFWHDEIDADKSLFWMAYNVNKRSITLNIETSDGRDLLIRLLQNTDFLIESLHPDYLARLGLSHAKLLELNPRLIIVSITWFGQSGPKAGYEGCDLTAWASAGTLFTMGDPDRAPTWVGAPQSAVIAAGEGCAGALTALWYREQNGKGQVVDVSVQDSLIWLLQAIPEMYDANEFIYKRAGQQWVAATGVGRRQIFACSDGYVAFTVIGGGAEGAVRSTVAMVEWMAEECAAPDWLINFDWRNEFSVQRLTPTLVAQVEEPFVQFIQGKSKNELFSKALAKGIILDKVSTAEDVLRDPQLEARDFWIPVDCPQTESSVIHCGPFVKMSRTPLEISRRAPRLGEHNPEVYAELGLSANEIVRLRGAGAI